MSQPRRAGGGLQGPAASASWLGSCRCLVSPFLAPEQRSHAFSPSARCLPEPGRLRDPKCFSTLDRMSQAPSHCPVAVRLGVVDPPGSCCPVPSANRPSTLARPVWEAAESRCRPPTRSHVVAAAAGQCRARTTGFSETGRGETLCFGPASVLVCAPVASVSQLTSPIVPRGRRRHHRITSRLPGARGRSASSS